MLRSFGIVENKIEEAEFFLSKIDAEVIHSPLHIQFYLSAFLSAARSITFCMQASISDLDGFEKWYSEKQAQLKGNELARFFLTARNVALKVGHSMVGGRLDLLFRDFATKQHKKIYFQNIPDIKWIPDDDVYTACEKYFILILNIIQDCYQEFGSDIDPDLYYTYENMIRLNTSLEDWEEETGFPRGWTNIPGATIEERIHAIKRDCAMPTVDWVFMKYLGKDRRGNTIVKH